MINTEQKRLICHKMLRLGIMDNKRNIIRRHTEGRTESISELTPEEAATLNAQLEGQIQNIKTAKSMKKMRSKILYLATACGYGDEDNGINWERFNNFMKTKSYLKKPFPQYTNDELPKLVSQFEQMKENIEQGRFNSYLNDELQEAGIKTKTAKS